MIERLFPTPLDVGTTITLKFSFLSFASFLWLNLKFPSWEDKFVYLMQEGKVIKYIMKRMGTQRSIEAAHIYSAYFSCTEHGVRLAFIAFVQTEVPLLGDIIRPFFDFCSLTLTTQGIPISRAQAKSVSRQLYVCLDLVTITTVSDTAPNMKFLVSLRFLYAWHPQQLS